MSDDNWKKFYEAKDEFIESLDIATANLLLKETGTDMRIRKQEIKILEKK